MLRKNIKKRHNETSEELIPAFLTADYVANGNPEPVYTSPPYDDESIDVIDHLSTSDLVINERLNEATRKNHIDLFIQPVVTLPQRHYAFYELFGRLRVKDGVYVTASDYMNHTRDEKIINNLDTALFSKCLNILQKQFRTSGSAAPCFINIKPFTLRNKAYMDSVLGLLSRYRHMANALVFEMPYADFATLSPAEQKIINGLAQIGCRFSADHLDEIPTDIKFLRAKNISFVKVEASSLIRHGKTDEGFSTLLSAKRNLDINNIQLIAEKIEREGDLLSLLDYDIRYGQGFLLGRPDFQGVYTSLRQPV